MQSPVCPPPLKKKCLSISRAGSNFTNQGLYCRPNEIGSELIFGSDWKKSDPITQKPVNIPNFCVDLCLVNLICWRLQCILLTMHPYILAFAKGLKRFWNLLTASPFADLLLDFFKARFRFLLVWSSVGKPEDRADPAEKVTFFESLETFLRLILICLLDGWQYKKTFFDTP